MPTDLLAHYKITYDASRHRYERFGVPLDSVSSVLPYLSNEWLDNNPQVMKKAEERGSLVADTITTVEHTEISGYENQALGHPLTLARARPDTYGWLEWYLKFKRETGFRAVVSPAGDIASELFVYHDILDYVGCLDLVGVCENLSKAVTVIDVKATALLPKTVGPQTAGYFEAYNRNAKFYGLPRATKRAVLWLTAKNYKYLPLDNPFDWPRFCSRLTDERWARELGYEVEWKPKNSVSPAGETLPPEEVFS